MLTRQISLSAPIFLIIYLFQEAAMNQFKLPGGGFSLFVIFALVWAVISTPEIAALTGFSAGILMDMSQSSSGPVGQWTLIMIIICYAVSYFYILDYIRNNFLFKNTNLKTLENLLNRRT